MTHIITYTEDKEGVKVIIDGPIYEHEIENFKRFVEEIVTKTELEMIRQLENQQAFIEISLNRKPGYTLGI